MPSRVSQRDLALQDYRYGNRHRDELDGWCCPDNDQEDVRDSYEHPDHRCKLEERRCCLPTHSLEPYDPTSLRRATISSNFLTQPVTLEGARAPGPVRLPVWKVATEKQTARSGQHPAMYLGQAHVQNAP